ncbi:MAG: hypothetical protein VKJ02_13585 [Snowella sp.]|nr:hypothetical protein [Snowella sp.]
MKNNHLRQKIELGLLGTVMIVAAIALLSYSSLAQNINNVETKPNLPDLSGLAWLQDDQFLAVHDSKSKDPQQPRVSLITLPHSSAGITWQPLNIDWEKVGGVALDLESMARIPQTDSFILAESGNHQDHSGRLFLMQFQNSTLTPIAVTNWPKTIGDSNIEGIAVDRFQDNYYLLYGDRAGGKPKTEICITSLSLEPFRMGNCQLTAFTTPDKTPQIRHISDLVIDDIGNLYIASAFDPNQDNGPFKSSVWKIGKIILDRHHSPIIQLTSSPDAIAEIDGFKVESLAIRPIQNQLPEIYIGTDDENYGGVIRLLPTKN